MVSYHRRPQSFGRGSSRPIRRAPPCVCDQLHAPAFPPLGAPSRHLPNTPCSSQTPHLPGKAYAEAFGTIRFQSPRFPKYLAPKHRLPACPRFGSSKPSRLPGLGKHSQIKTLHIVRLSWEVMGSIVPHARSSHRPQSHRWDLITQPGSTLVISYQVSLIDLARALSDVPLLQNAAGPAEVNLTRTIAIEQAHPPFSSPMLRRHVLPWIHGERFRLQNVFPLLLCNTRIRVASTITTGLPIYLLDGARKCT